MTELETLNEEIISCEKCPLHLTAKKAVCGFGNITADMMFIAEAPGATEEGTGIPLTGRAGKLLDGIIEGIDINRDEVYVSNVCHHRPPSNRTPTKEEIKACLPFLEREIDIVKPKVIITLGNVATRALTKEIKISNARGNTYKYKDSWIVPTYHPAYLLRNPHNKSLVVKDILIAKGLLKSIEIENDYKIIENEGQALFFLDSLIENYMFSCDVESTGLDFTKEDLLGIGFSYKTHSAFYINSNMFTKKIKNKIKQVLTNDNLYSIFHYGKFDLKFIKHFLGFEVTNFQFDTMLAHQLLDVNARHGLEHLSARYPDLAGYKEESKPYLTKKKLEEGDFSSVPPDVLARRCMVDCDVTMRLFSTFYNDLEKEDLLDLYNNLVHPLTKVLMNIEYEGNDVDKKRLDDLKVIYSLETVNCLVKVKDYVKDKTGINNFNINSNIELSEILHDKLKLPVIKRTKITKKPSVDEESLKKLSLKGHKIAKLLLAYRKAKKILSVYIVGVEDSMGSDDKLHTTYGIVRTGRKSSSNPNLQNFPRSNDIRGMIIPPEGFVFLRFDYSQIELRCLAFCSGDEEMLKAFRAGKDIHAETGEYIFGVKEMTVEQRVKAKTTNFAISYGISASGLAKGINDALFDEGITTKSEFASVSDCEEFIKQWFNKYKGVHSWIRSVKRQVRRDGYVKNIFGRKRDLPEIFSSDKELRSWAERGAVNTQIQGMASDYVDFGLLNVCEFFRKNDLYVRPTLPVHDEISFIIPDLGEKDLKIAGYSIANKMTNCVPEVEKVVTMKVGFTVMNRWEK